MKKSLTLLILISSVLIGWQCTQEQPGTTLLGKIEGSENLQVFIDKVVYGKANAVIGKGEIGKGGTFSINFPEGLLAGIYNVRIGAKRISLVLDGNEKEVEVNGQLSTIQNYDIEIKGSNSSQVLAETMVKLISRQMSADDIQTFVDTTQSPLLGSFVAYRALGQNGSYLGIHKKAAERLNENQGTTEIAESYSGWVATVEQVYQQQMMRERVKIGSPAPDIKLPTPDGKEYALSDLKGQVVLLDFWASWCGPCRRENPNVVKVYDKYKDRGFTIFSVSLDGIDSRTAGRLDAEQTKTMLASQKNRWISAISQDKLTWPYHVSDLKKWDCAPAKNYGVSSIPRAFMINREGIIVSTSVRGAKQIEEELLKHI